MKKHTTLQARLIDHGRSEIWLEADGEELTKRRNLATNEVVYVTRRHCTVEDYERFYADYHRVLGNIASLSVPNLEQIAAELRLST